MKKPVAFSSALFLALFVTTNILFATATTISTNSTTALSLSGGDSLTVTSTGTLTVGSSTVAVTLAGSSASLITVDNSGAIKQTGTGRVLRDNKGGLTVSITNEAGALLQSADADVIQMNVAGSSITLNNYGTMTSLNASKGGSQAVDFNALTTGSNTLNNYSTGLIQAANADAVRPGVNGVVTNDGTIKATTTTDASSDGIDAQNNSGVSITNANTNTSTSLIEGARHGITGGASSSAVNFTMSITNNAKGTIQGDNGSGINIDGFNANEVVTISNTGTITGNGVSGDGDGVDVDGLVNLTNSGTIKSLNANADVSEGVTVGGGTIINSGTIEGSVTSAGALSGSVGRGITLAGVDKDAGGNAIPIQTIYANSTVTNNAGGLIKGDSDSGIAVHGVSGSTAFTVMINNSANATIEGGGATAAAIDGSTVGNSITINNAGTIKADSSGLAIAMGSGTNAVNITGGSAHVLGDINGGTGSTTVSINTGSGNSFNYKGTISHVTNVAMTAGSTFAAGGDQPAAVTDGSSNLANGSTTIDTTGFNVGPGGTPNAILSINQVNLTFALGTGDANSGSQIGITGAVANSVAFTGTSTVTINDLVGTHLVLNQEYVLIAGNGSTTFTGLQLGSTTALGQQIVGGLTLLADKTSGNAFSQIYTGSKLFLSGDNIVVDVAPEPETWALLFGGMALLAGARKLRRRV